MGLVHKLYKIGSLLNDDDIKAMIENTNFKDSEHIVVTIDFNIQNDKLTETPKIKHSSLDNIKTFFTKKIGGTSNSYYLYPNFEFQDEKDLYKKFQAISHTLKNSIMIYANNNNQALAKLIFDYVDKYNIDELGLKNYKQDDYFLILLINGKSFYELMPEILENYIDVFVEPHIDNDKKGATLKECVDIINNKSEICGYNPNIKFFTMDNYDDGFKIQIINKMPMSKDTAKAVKKGWMFAINYLRFYYKGLEYIIIPSMIDYDEVVFKDMIYFLRESKGGLGSFASREESFIWLLDEQINSYKNINGFTLDIFFTDVNLTNLSVKIFATLEDVLPSKIRKVANLMQQQRISDSIDIIKGDKNEPKTIYLRDYFGTTELFKRSRKLKTLDNKILQEKIVLAKILLGYSKIKYQELLKRFEYFREFEFDGTKKLDDNGVKKWISFPNSYIENEDRVLKFLQEINAIKG
ncbi:hypothetical protein [Campylobacter sp. 7477a]|uniref:hypothetical protein n=1 Tax=Campylobacter sp. 7477a TaxID=2735741 RepID=UPI003015546F|nr:hypothetical protein [Campylobacter sp. 7477a]